MTQTPQDPRFETHAQHARPETVPAGTGEYSWNDTSAAEFAGRYPQQAAQAWPGAGPAPGPSGAPVPGAPGMPPPGMGAPGPGAPGIGVPFGAVGGPGAPLPPAAPPDHAGSKRPLRFGLGVLAALAIVSAAVGGVAGGYFGSHYADAATPVASASTITGTDSSTTTTNVGAVADKVLPSVVQVNEQTSSVQGTGSGMVISSTGLIVTNNHVIADYVADGGTLSVTTYDGKTYNAKVIGYITADDIAVIQAEGVSGWTPVTFADSSKVQVGDQAIAIGSPDGLQNTVTSGIVSALNRKVSVDESTNGGGGFPGFGWNGLGQSTTVTYSAIQTDASINPGNSGGPLLDSSGDVMGMDSAIYSSSSDGSEAGSVGLGFAIPSNTVTADIQKIENGGGDTTN
jgi:putative serine protease PepD